MRPPFIPEPRRGAPLPIGALRCRRKFLRFFSGGFHDEKYLGWERDYKWHAHERWQEHLNASAYRSLLRAGRFSEIATIAVQIESRTNLLFSFEKMAVRDAVKTDACAEAFAKGLYRWLYGTGKDRQRFERWRDTVASLPRRQTRVLTWPVLTVFGFLAEPSTHFFLKPSVTQTAADEYGFDFNYLPKPTWEVYASALNFAKVVGRDLRDLGPRDMIDIQSFLWVQGSSEYLEEAA